MKHHALCPSSCHNLLVRSTSSAGLDIGSLLLFMGVNEASEELVAGPGNEEFMGALYVIIHLIPMSFVVSKSSRVTENSKSYVITVTVPVDL